MIHLGFRLFRLCRFFRRDVLADLGPSERNKGFRLFLRRSGASCPIVPSTTAEPSSSKSGLAALALGFVAIARYY